MPGHLPGLHMNGECQTDELAWFSEDPMPHRVRIPKAYHPRNAVDLAAAPGRLGGNVSFLFSAPHKDASGMITSGRIVATVLDYEPEPHVAQLEGVVRKEHKEPLRRLARMAAKAWATSASRPVPAAMHWKEAKKK
jgi:hypothetical protein